MTLFRTIIQLVLGLIVINGVYGQEESMKRTAPLPSNKGIYEELQKLPEGIRKSGPFARFVHRLSRYAGESGVYDADARYESFKEAQSHLVRDASIAYKSGGKYTPFADAWVNVGPTGVGGCTKAIAIDPTNQSIIYAGAAGGGVWKSTNGGGAWTILTQDVMPDLATVSIAIDPSNPSTIFVGSGDGSVASDALAGTGLYKSSNSGSSWTRVASTTLPKCVNKVLVHPSNSNIVFATNFDGAGSNGRGLYRSTNGGTTFSRVFPTTKNADGIIWDIVPGQTIGGKLIMYMVEGNNPSGASNECGVYKSIDDGATWGKLTNATLPAGTAIGKAALACPKNAPEKVFVFMATPSGDLQGLFRSTNSGSAWTKINTVPSTIFAPGASAPQGWYDLCMAVSPNAATVDTILLGGVEAYYSHDGGSNWTSYSDYNVNFNVHVDHHAIVMDQRNPRIIYIGTDGGIYRSLNAGANWTYRDNGYHTMRFYRIGLDKNDFKRTLGGTQDQGVWQTVSGQASTSKFGGDGFQPIIDPSNSNTFYVEGPYGELYKTTNGGGNYAPINGSNFEEQSAWSTPFVMAPKSNTTLYTGRTKVWRSLNAGGLWSAISGVIGNPFILCLAVSPSNGNIIYAGMGGGKIMKTTNSGSNWDDVSPNASSNVTSIVCHPTNPNIAVASFAASSITSIRVMKTTNGGTTWTNASGTGTTALPGAPVNQLAIDSLSPSSTWYAATDNGIYYTLDTGKKWSIAGSGIGLSPCWDVQIHPNKITIRVGTHGRSIWEANTNILPVELSSLEAVKTTSGTELRWRTDSERGSSHFIVERSYNYAPFENIHEEQALGNSSTPHDYLFFDGKTDDGYYIYRLRQVDLDGAERVSNTVEVRYGSAARFRLDQNFPNPYVAKDGGATKVRFELPEDDVVTLRVFSATGQLVRTLAEGQFFRAGDRDVLWDGLDINGIPAASGVYQYVLEAQRFGSLWNKMVVIGK
jgi:photosystem II stability/assembly factor-like uncharacterized protein